ncbi:MAG: sugar transferase [bacterium]
MIYRALERLFAAILIVIFLPLLGILYVVVRLDSKGPFLFLQLRAGKEGKPFWMYKIRTMGVKAESLKQKVKNLNEADGPVFKIKNDPRYTRIGKYLSRTALDELPQLMNILEGHMAFVGPRPLPLSEAQNIPKKYRCRFSVLPGMTSEWVVQGAHELPFKRWMELDCNYAKKRSIMNDISILQRTVFVVMGMIFRK